MRADGLILIAGLVAALIIAGCAKPVRKDAVPQALTTKAVVPGLADVRYRVSIDTEALRKESIESLMNGRMC